MKEAVLTSNAPQPIGHIPKRYYQKRFSIFRGNSL